MRGLRRALVGGVAMVLPIVVFTGCDPSISAHYMAAPSGAAVSRVWTAPRAGVVDIRSLVVSDPQSGAMKVWIAKNEATIWGPETVAASSARGDLSALTVAAGDVVRLVAEPVDDQFHAGAKILWDPDVKYE